MEKKILTFDDFEKMLKQKSLKYKRNGDRIVSGKRKTCENGHKIEIKLFIEKMRDDIVGTVYGLGKNRFAIDPEDAISEYQKEIVVFDTLS